MSFGANCPCDGREDAECQEHSCKLATGPGAPGNSNQCRHCWLRLGGDSSVVAGAGYTTPSSTAPRKLMSCAHFGTDTGQKVLCPSCPNGKVELNVFTCRVHGTCTPLKAVDNIACCTDCPDYESKGSASKISASMMRSDRLVQVACTSDGLGDALLMLTTCQGLTNAGKHVYYALLGGQHGSGAAWQVPWVELFGGYASAGAALLVGQHGRAPTYYPYRGYGEENRTRLAKPRWAHYANGCGGGGVAAALPAPKPLEGEAVAFVERYEGRVVLSPFSAHASRAWALPNWLLLERLLYDAGKRCVVLDGRSHGNTARTERFLSPILRDEAAARVGALLSVAGGFIGNDSGMAHVAGLMRTRGVVLCSQVRGEQVYGIYPSLKVMNGGMDCGGCHWQRQAGWLSRCEKLCADLQSIAPESVVAALNEACPSPS